MSLTDGIPQSLGITRHQTRLILTGARLVEAQRTMSILGVIRRNILPLVAAKIPEITLRKHPERPVKSIQEYVRCADKQLHMPGAVTHQNYGHHFEFWSQ